VRYRVTHRDGTDEVVLDQHGGGAGTEELPRIVTASPFVDRDDVTRSSSYLLFHYACDGAPEQSGAEVIYKVTTATEGDIEALLLADPGVELDVVLLDKLEESGCLQWGDMLVLQEDAPAGTYWIVVDTRTEGTEAPAPGGYELRVTFGGEPDGDSAMAPGQADTWVSLGSYPFAPGKDPAQGAIALELDEGPVPVIEGPARAVADAVWLYNPGRDFFAFGEGAEGSEVAEDILILKEYAAVGVASAESWPVREAPSADAPVRFRARQGQRFLSDTNYEGWYEIHAPELGYEVGYLHEDAGFVYNRLVEEPIPEGDDDDSAAPPPGDDDGCECDAAPGAGVGAVAWLALLVTGLVSRRARRSPPGRR